MKTSIPNSIYGPVHSWRLGNSLGIDLLCVDSICSFECVYCQLGKISRLTKYREIFVSTEKVVRDLKKSDWKKAEVITFSGSGEPTLAKNLGEVIEKVKETTAKPIVVLTNSSLLNLSEVRAEISKVDKIFCKLDAWSDESLRRINRPSENILSKEIVLGIKQLRHEYKGFLAIQTMILRQPKDSELEKFADILRLIKPNEIQLNLPTRPVPPSNLIEARGNELEIDHGFTQIKTISEDELEKIRQHLSELTDIPIITPLSDKL